MRRLAYPIRSAEGPCTMGYRGGDPRDKQRATRYTLEARHATQLADYANRKGWPDLAARWESQACEWPFTACHDSDLGGKSTALVLVGGAP